MRRIQPMKKNKATIINIIFSLILIFNANLRSQAQDSNKFIILPPGTTFEARIDHTISSAKSHSGDKFVLEVVSPVIANGTDVVIAQGSKVIGEVVEAIPSSKIPKLKGDPKPIGKLQIELTTIETPQGNSYPLVASLMGELVLTGQTRKINPDLGAGIGYVGSQNNFNAIKPGANSIYSMGRRPGSGPALTHKKDLINDPIYGIDSPNPMSNSSQKSQIRSLVKKNNELYIYEGSPLTVKLDTPLKIPYGKSPTTLSEPISQPVNTSNNQANVDFGSVKHFSKNENTNLNNNNNNVNTNPINQNPF